MGCTCCSSSTSSSRARNMALSPSRRNGGWRPAMNARRSSMRSLKPPTQASIPRTSWRWRRSRNGKLAMLQECRISSASGWPAHEDGTMPSMPSDTLQWGRLAASDRPLIHQVRCVQAPPGTHKMVYKCRRRHAPSTSTEPRTATPADDSEVAIDGDFNMDMPQVPHETNARGKRSSRDRSTQAVLRQAPSDS